MITIGSYKYLNVVAVSAHGLVVIQLGAYGDIMYFRGGMEL